METNDHLLSELRDTKDKHQHEIEQMHWSYNQLKTTLAYSSVLKPSPLSQNNSNIDPSQLSGGKERQDRDGSATGHSANRLSNLVASKS